MCRNKIFAILLCVFPLVVQAYKNDLLLPKLEIISISLPPLQYYDEQNELRGYFVEVIQAAMATTKFQYDMQLYPWARSYKWAQTKANVCIFSLNRIPEREPLFKWVALLAETHSAVYSLKNSNISIKNLQDAKHYKGATIRDGVYHQLLLRNGFEENKNIYVVGNSDSLVKLFYANTQIDFILSDDIVLDRLARKLNIDSSAFKRQFFLDIAPLKDYIACSHSTSDQSISALKLAFKTIKENGALAKINNRWRSKLGNIIIE